MTSNLPIWLIADLFWPMLILDYLLITSFIFLFVYPAGLLFASALPQKLKMTPNSLGLPLLLLLSAILPFTWPGNYCASALNHYLRLALADTFLMRIEEYLPVLLALAIWLPGVAVLLFGLVRKCLDLRRLLRGAASAGEDPAFLRALETVRPGRGVKLKEAPGLASAASWGFFGATVLVPPGFTERHRAGERYAVYVHELMHLKRRDSLKLLAMSALRALFWFNPLFWRAAARYRNHLEVACDRAVLGHSEIDRQGYAGLLLAATAGQNDLVPGFSSAYGEAARRLRYIFHDRSILPPRRDRIAALCCVAAVLVSLSFFKEEPLPVVPWGATHSIPDEDGVLMQFNVYFDWHGVLGSYVIAD